MSSLPYRPLMTLACFLAVLMALLVAVGCSTTQASNVGLCCGQCLGDANADMPRDAKFAQDRAAILGMAGEYNVTFGFQEVLGVRAGYELTEPYSSAASELVIVIEDSGDFISLQHLLVVSRGGETSIVKHWRQDWSYEQVEGYSYEGNNTWLPIAFDADNTQGLWVQSVYQVDDSPRYWGQGAWRHAGDVSTWTGTPTNRPLPRRESTKRSDYHILAGVNTHVVTPHGWMHYQHNYKHDIEHETSPVIALESGVNTYERTAQVDFAEAHEYWDNTHAYWAKVRLAWDEIYAARDAVSLRSAVRGDAMYSHLFDLADEYWGDTECTDAKERIQAVIGAFRADQAIAQP